MKKRALLKHGDIFYLKIGNQDKYIFGRVLFDVKRQYHKIRDTNNLPKSIHSLTYLMDSYSDCQLIEVFEGIYNRIEDFNIKNTKVLIPRIFTRSIDGNWNLLEYGKVGNLTVDYTLLEFPEQMTSGGFEEILCWGELCFASKISDIEMQKRNYNYRPLKNGTKTIVSICACLQNERNLSLIETEFDLKKNLIEHDLLYNLNFRNQIFNNIGIDPNESYYHLSKNMGFDLARFYE